MQKMKVYLNLSNLFLPQTLKEFFLELGDINWVTFGIGISAIVLQVVNNELIKVSVLCPHCTWDFT